MAEPRIVVSMGDRWACVVLCAELRERGYVAGCADGLSAALLLPEPRQVGPVRAVLVDHESLRDRDLDVLRWLRMSGHGPATVVVIAGDASVPAGPWEQVLRRPVTIGEIADVIQQWVRSTARMPPDIRPEGIDLRFGSPWPTARCARCGCSRHCTAPRNAIEREEARIALVQFAVEHEHRP